LSSLTGAAAAAGGAGFCSLSWTTIARVLGFAAGFPEMAGFDERSGCWAETELEALITSPRAINPIGFNIARLLSSEPTFAVGVPGGDQSNEKKMTINIDEEESFRKPERRRQPAPQAMVTLYGWRDVPAPSECRASKVL
jgi:hypothetical protein